MNESRPTIVCLCGSTRFYKQFESYNLQETLAGHIVLSIGANAKDETLNITAEQKVMLDNLHLAKIDLADEVLVLNIGGYIGTSTRNEIRYATMFSKPIRYAQFHTEQCMQETSRTIQALELWEVGHPNYCKSCRGYGLVEVSFDPSPAGVSLGSGSMTDYDICVYCLEKGKCSLCGGDWSEYDEECEKPCIHCGYVPGEDNGCPYVYECYCYEIEAKEFYRQEYKSLGVDLHKEEEV